MSRMFLGPSNKIEVGLSFNETDDALLAAATAIAKRTGMTARLFHALEPFFEESSAQHVPLSTVFEETAELVQKERRRAARDSFEQRVAGLSAEIELEFSVVAGDACDALMTDAQSNYVRMTVIGSGRHGEETLAGFAIASRLLAEATMPVLAIPRHFQLRPAPERVRMLIADDLSPACDSAVRTALDLACAIGQVDVAHVHVNGVTVERLSCLLEAAACEMNSDAALVIDARGAVEASEHSLAIEVARRAGRRAESLAACGGTYRVEVLTGPNPLEEIERAAMRLDTDFLVFGRHGAVHQAPCRLGHLPFQAMMRQDRAVMVVPVL